MAKTPSVMVELGSSAPHFCLPDPVTNEEVSLDDVLSDTATVIVFMCNHCPFVLYIEDCLLSVARTYIDKGISFVGINSNDVTKYPDDSPEKMRKRSDEKQYPFPYLFDESQEVAKAYNAACTPDFFVYDGDGILVYRGQFDAARPGLDVPVTGKSLTAALDALIAGNPVSTEQIPSLGCNIKWKE